MPSRPPRAVTPLALLRGAGVALACAVTAKVVDPQIPGSLEAPSILWASGGVALSAALRWGPAFLIPAALGILAARIGAGAPLGATVVLTGIQLAGLAHAWRQLRRFDAHPLWLEDLPSALHLLRRTAEAVLAIALGRGLILLALGITLVRLPRPVLASALSDLLGLFLIPLLLQTFLHLGWTTRWRTRWPEKAAFALGIGASSLLIYRGIVPQGLDVLVDDALILLFLIWGAFRFGAEGVAIFLLALLPQVLFCAQGGWGPFSALPSPLRFWVAWLATALLTAGSLGMATTLARRRRDQEALQAAEAHLQSLVTHLPVGLVLHGPDTAIRQFNAQACALLGLSEDEMLGRAAPDPAWRFLREDGTPMPLEEYPVTQVLTTERPLIGLVIGIQQPAREDPTWVMANAYPLRNPGGKVEEVVVVFSDITELMTARVRLQRDQIQLAEVMAFARIGDWEYDLEADRITFSDAYLSLLGTRAEDLGGRTMDAATFASRFLHPEDAHIPQECIREMQAFTGSVFERTLVNRQCRADGREITTRVAFRAERRPDGRLGPIQGITQDISELAAKEAELRRLALVAERTASSVVITDPDGRLVWANPAFTRMTGYTLDEALGSVPGHLLQGPDTDPATVEAMRRNLASRTSFDAEVLNYTKGGTPYWNHLIVDPVYDEGGRHLGFISVQSDLTSLKEKEHQNLRLERELLHLQKLESLGTLASGVSHDMNNVLGAILGALTAALRRGVPEALRSPLEAALSAAERGRELVRNLNTFARKEQAGFQMLDANQLVEQEASILRASTFRRVEVDCALAPGPLWILGDRDAVGNALMNLCTNAIDAMGGHGRLRLETEEVGGEVHLRVIDEGEGMSEEVLQRATEPFFTTKGVGKGTGLGLAMAHGTMNRHGGSLQLQSRVGEGTTVTLRFPAQRPPQEDPREVGVPVSTELPPAQAPERVTTASPDGTGLLRALLVDDDDLIRETTELLLRELQVEPTSLSSGRACLEHLETHAPPDVLILDHAMPGLTGLETLRRIRDLGLKVPVVFTSGNFDASQAEDLPLLEPLLPLRKPFALDELEAALAWVRRLDPR